MTSAWLRTHVASIAVAQIPEAPLITADDVRPMIEGLDLWDMWPLALGDGVPAQVLGGTLWMYLAAPRFEDPALRHDHAEIRLLHLLDGRWRDCGRLLPQALSPGGREWSGSALLDPTTSRVTLFFTAAGRRGAAEPRFEQRLFEATGRLDLIGPTPSVVDWTAPWEFVRSDGETYVRTDLAPAAPGLIKGFRDPGYFQDPVEGGRYVLFTGSLAGSSQSHNGVIGVARATDARLNNWRLLPPLVSADGLCNEMERPHIVRHDGLYYLFWSSQASVFAPSGPGGPTGLYGMVADRFEGPYRPLNGSALVIANPAAAPKQAYCWWVTPDLTVASFVDQWDSGGADPRGFGGTAAPTLRLSLDGDRTRLLGPAWTPSDASI